MASIRFVAAVALVAIGAALYLTAAPTDAQLTASVLVGGG